MKLISRFRLFILCISTLLLCAALSFINIASSYASDDSDQARDTAKEILSQKQFADDKGDAPLSDDVKRISDWLGESKSEKRVSQEKKVEKQVEQQKQNEAKNLSLPNLSGFAYIVVIILAALTIGAIGFFIYKLISMREKKDKDKAKDESDEIDVDDIAWEDEEHVLNNIDDVDLLEQLADKAYNEGRYDIALRYRFRAGLLRLDKIQLIHFHPSITNNSYQIMLNSVVFNSLVKTFNDVTYGKANCDIAIHDTAKQSWQILINDSQGSNKKISPKDGSEIL